MSDLRIGQVAKQAGVGVETIRFYELKGLLEQPLRPPSGYRQYPEVAVHDMNDPVVAQRAREAGVRSLPAIVIDGRLADCCIDRGPDEPTLREAGLGQALA